MDVPSTIAAALAGRRVQWAPALAFDFTTGVERIWSGAWPLVSGGHTWTGAPGVVTNWDEILNSFDATAPDLVLRLAGVGDGVLSAAAGEDKATYVGRLMTLSLQFFSDAWAPLDAPQVIWCGFMQPLEVVRTAQVRAINLPCAHVFARRWRARAGSYSDRHQQRRYAGDLFCAFMGDMQNKVIKAPGAA